MPNLPDQKEDKTTIVNEALSIAWLRQQLIMGSPTTVDEFREELSSKSYNKVFTFFVIFNDSTGMASGIYFITISIFSSTLIAWMGLLGATVVALIFSFELYRTSCRETEKKQQEVEKYEKLIKDSVDQQAIIIQEISILFKQLEEKKISLPPALLTTKDSTSLKTQEDKQSYRPKNTQALVELLYSANKINKNEEVAAEEDPWKIRFLITLVTSAGIIFTFGKLILAALGINILGPVGIILASSIIFGYSLPIAIVQRVINKKNKRYVDELKNEKERVRQISTGRIQKLLGLKKSLAIQLENPGLSRTQSASNLNDVATSSSKHPSISSSHSFTYFIPVFSESPIPAKLGRTHSAPSLTLTRSSR
jgi:hypothetical protein